MTMRTTPNFKANPGAYLAERTDVRSADECWPWLLSTGSHGYGQGYDGDTVRTAHSLTWEFWHGYRLQMPMTIDHICRNRICQNPLHLRALTNEQNGRENGMWVRTHCKHGHEYTKDNTRMRTDKNGRVFRRCLTCQDEYNAARYR